MDGEKGVKMFKTKWLKSKITHVLLLTIILIFVIVYLIKLPGTLAYLIPPVLWSLAFIIAYPYVRKGPASGASFLVTIFLLSITYIVVNMFLGLLTEVGKSPYTLSLFATTINMFYGLTKLLGLEYSRAYFSRKVLSLGSRKSFTIMLSTAVFYTVILINPYEYTSLQDLTTVLRFINKPLLPLLAENIFLTQVVILGGPLYSLTYKAIILMFYNLSPILPNLPWTIYGLVNVLIPLIGTLIIMSSKNVSIMCRSIVGEKERVKVKSYLWIVPVMISLLIISGALGIKPYVIVSKSMEPTLSIGDIVFVYKAEFNEAKISDIIAYFDGEKVVIHRVYNIDKANGKYMYLVTKGDAVKNPDPVLVSKEMFLGKMAFKIPYMGLAIIYLKEALNHVLLNLKNVMESIKIAFVSMLIFIVVNTSN